MTRVNGIERIARVSYEYLGAYQVVNRNFFSLQTHTSNFRDLYLQRDEDKIVDRISSELFDTFRSLGIAPILKISEDDQLTVKIQKKLVGYFKEGHYESKFKPLLTLFNRKRDIQGMFYHAWKYICLIQDIFGILGN